MTRESITAIILYVDIFKYYRGALTTGITAGLSLYIHGGNQEILVCFIGSSHGKEISTNTAVAGRGHHLEIIVKREEELTR